MDQRCWLGFNCIVKNQAQQINWAKKNVYTKEVNFKRSSLKHVLFFRDWIVWSDKIAIEFQWRSCGQDLHLQGDS